MQAFQPFCLQAKFSKTLQNRFFCLWPCFSTPEQKYGLKSKTASQLSLSQFVRRTSTRLPFYHDSSFCYLRMAKRAVLTRNCTLFDMKFPLISHEKFSNTTRELFKLHVWTFESPHVALAKSTWKVLFFDTFRSVQFLTLWRRFMYFCLHYIKWGYSICRLTSQNILYRIMH